MTNSDLHLIPVFFISIICLIAGSLAAKRKGRRVGLWALLCGLVAPLLVILEFLPSARAYNDSRRKTWPGLVEWAALGLIGLSTLSSVVNLMDPELSQNLDTNDKVSSDTAPSAIASNDPPMPTNGDNITSLSGQNDLTFVQKNAVRSATRYLSVSGFSRAGLIYQLSSDAGDGYSVSDATIAVDSLDVDWDENAVRSAKRYLEMSGFSCKGLIHQLSAAAGDKYTLDQATYGARKVGACGPM